MAFSKEEKKARTATAYPSPRDKMKFEQFAEKNDMSLSSLFIEGAKMFIKSRELEKKVLAPNTRS